MSGNLQPKGLYELAFGSFITYMENEARQLLKLEPSPEAVTVTSRVCGELKRFFHSMRLLTCMTNQLTKHLLIKLDSMYHMFKSSIQTECCQQMLLSLVEVFVHPDVTAIELGASYSHGFDFTPCNFITCIILQKVCNLHNLKILNLPPLKLYHVIGIKPVFSLPCQLRELTVSGSSYWSDEVLRNIVECCPELKSLTIQHSGDAYLDITLLLQCKHLETLRLSYSADDIYMTLINGLSTDATSDVLAASTLKSFSASRIDQNTLNLIVDKLPHLTEIHLACGGNKDLSGLTQLKNLRSLSLDVSHKETANEYKKILPVLGENLVFLELRIYCSLAVELIGETCTNLKCLHLHIYFQCANQHPSLTSIPNFKTIECLKVKSYLPGDLASFLIAQCINIKTLIVDVNCDTLNTVEDVLRRTPPLNWVVIKYDVFERRFIESLPSRHPNFHVVKTRYWMRLSSQAEVFDSFGCYT